MSAATPDSSAPPVHVVQNPGKTRVAIVGAGFISSFHLEALQSVPEAEVVAICDPAEERARALADAFDVPHAVGSIEELPGLGVQVVHLLTPPTSHAALTRSCLEVGLGAFVEKPFTLDAKEARALGELAREQRLALGINHNALFHPGFVRLKERALSGELGAIEHVQVTLSVPLRQLDAGQISHWMFAEPQNIVHEQGPHPFSQVHALVGAVDKCSTTLLNTRELQPGQDFHDAWSVSASAERGSVEAYLAFGRAFPKSSINVLCTDGQVEVDLLRGALSEEQKTVYLDFWNDFLASWRRGGSLRREARRGLRDYLAATLGLAARQDPFFAGLRGSVQGFHAALRSGERLPVDAFSAAEVIDWCTAVAKPAVTRAKRKASDEPAPAPPVGGEPAQGEVCVLGGTGFIGKPTVRKLLERGLPVSAVVRRTHGLPPLITDGAREGKLRLERGSLSDTEGMRAAVRGAKVVVHLATGNGATWEEVQRDMVDGSAALARAAAEEGVQRLIYVSSIAALYLGPDAPGWSEHEGLMDSPEADPQPDERSIYGRGKAAAERAVFAVGEETDLAVTIVRPGVVMGLGTAMQHSGLGLWARDNHCVGWGDGRHPLPLVWHEDVAEALAALAAYEGDELDGQALNLCARVDLNAREVVAELARHSGRAFHFHGRSMHLSQGMELGKWVVKRVGGRKVDVPSWRDLKSRSLRPPFACDLARRHLEWRPVEEREEFLAKVVRPMATGVAPD